MKFNLQGDFYNNAFFNDSEHPDEAIEKINPANLDEKLWVSYIKYDHIENVLDSALQGFKKWKVLNFHDRINYLKKYQENLLLVQDELALAISMETGKPLWEAKGEVKSVVSKVDITITDSLKRIDHQKYPKIMENTDGEVFFKPIGPCLIIGPFNFPCHLAGGQILSALLAGNSIIFKPSEKTIYSGEILIRCFQKAEFPSGVINFICGAGETAARLVKSKIIKGIFFTGSKEVGQKILNNTYQDLSKLVALELGGKNTSIVHQDANLKFVLPELLQACYLTTGQRCTSTAIVAIHRSLLDQFVSQFHDLAKRIIIDHPTVHDKTPFMGPLIDDRAQNNYLLYVGMGKREGAEEIMRGKSINKKHKGYYVSPSIHLMEKANPKSIFLNSEIFGPDCTIIPYDTIDEAIAIANITEYGLASSIFSNDKHIQEFCLTNIDAGIINVNRSTVGASSRLPFGGIKSSGNYRPAAVSMIDACAYPVASLSKHPEENPAEVIGLM